MAALVAALDDDPRAAAAGAQLVSTEGEAKACAWRLPGPGHRAGHGGVRRTATWWCRAAAAVTRQVGWVQSSAMLVRRRAAEEVGYLDPDFFVYSDETDFCKRLHDAGWKVLFVPAARAIHHDQLNTDLAARRGGGSWSSTATATSTCASTTARRPRLAVRALGGVVYLACALAARSRPGHDPRRYLVNVRQELSPGRGEGIREAADEYNSRHGTP